MAFLVFPNFIRRTFWRLSNLQIAVDRLTSLIADITSVMFAIVRLFHMAAVGYTFILLLLRMIIIIII